MQVCLISQFTCRSVARATQCATRTSVAKRCMTTRTRSALKRASMRAAQRATMRPTRPTVSITLQGPWYGLYSTTTEVSARLQNRNVPLFDAPPVLRARRSHALQRSVAFANHLFGFLSPSPCAHWPLLCNAALSRLSAADKPPSNALCNIATKIECRA